MTSRHKITGYAVFLCLPLIGLFYFNALALEKKGALALGHYIMGAMYDKMGQSGKAVEEYNKALKADSDTSVIHLNLAASYIKQNNLDKAVKELNEAISVEADAVEPHTVLALIYSIQNKPELARNEYETALKIASQQQPQNIDIYKSLGLVYLQKQDFPAAQNVYQLILEISPRDAEAHFYLGNVFYETGNAEASLAELKKAIELNPGYADAMNFLGYIYADENRKLDEAENLIKKALEIDPENGAYIDSLGWVYFRRQKFKEAIQELEKASSLMEDPVIYDHLGEAYLAIGDKEKAEANWQRSLVLDPSQQEIKNKLERAAAKDDKKR